MVRLKAPLFSLEASGTLGKSVVFAKWKGRDYARRHAIPANPKSGLQTGVRAVFGWCAAYWGGISAGAAAQWASVAANTDVTPLNAFVAESVNRARRNLGWAETPSPTASTTADAPTAPTATAQPNTLVLHWSHPVANQPTYCYAIYASESMGFVPDISNLVGIIDASFADFTHRNLPSGTTMYYRIRGLNLDGSLGTLCAEFNGTTL